MVHGRMSRRKPAPDLIRGGNRFAEKDMRHVKHVSAKACPGLDPGWQPVRRKEHAPCVWQAGENSPQFWASRAAARPGIQIRTPNSRPDSGFAPAARPGMTISTFSAAC